MTGDAADDSFTVLDNDATVESLAWFLRKHYGGEGAGSDPSTAQMFERDARAIILVLKQSEEEQMS